MIGWIVMFIISLKSDKVKKLFALFVALILTLIGGVVYVSTQGTVPVSNIGGIDMKAFDAMGRTAFLSQFGWKINPDPVEVKEIVIPEEFDDVYSEYNEIQKQQGLDLEIYKGVRVKHWSYEVLNYPGYENSDGAIRANLLIYEGIVIGGDISNITLDGFMHTFFIPSEESTALSTQED